MSGCEFCGGPIQRRHHPTGRDEHGGYLDPEFRRPLCHDHHELVGDDLYTLELVRTPGHLTWFERVEIRLRRWAAYCARLDQASPTPSVYGLLASVLERWANELARAIRLLDELFPEWREHPEFYPRRGGEQ